MKYKKCKQCGMLLSWHGAFYLLEKTKLVIRKCPQQVSISECYSLLAALDFPLQKRSSMTLHRVYFRLYLLKDVGGWQFFTMKVAETLRIVCLPPEEHIS